MKLSLCRSQLKVARLRLSQQRPDPIEGRPSIRRTVSPIRSLALKLKRIEREGKENEGEPPRNTFVKHDATLLPYESGKQALKKRSARNLAPSTVLPERFEMDSKKSTKLRKPLKAITNL